MVRKDSTDDDFAEDEAFAWRNQLALMILRGLLVIFVLSAVIAWVAIRGSMQRYVIMVLAPLLTIVIAIPAFTGRPSGRARAWLVMVPSLFVAISGYAFNGYVSGVGAILSVTLMLSGLLMGRRAMIGFTLFAAVAVALIGWAMVHGHLRPPNPDDTSMLNGRSWTRSLIFTFFAISLFGGLMVAVVTRMERSLRLARTETQRREQAERGALEARQLEVVGRLAAGIAHDFNNNLTAIMGCAELLQREHGEAGAGRELASSILHSSLRLAELTRQLLAYSRRAPMVQAPTDLHVLLRDAVALLRRSIDPRVCIVSDFTAPNSTVAADVTLLQGAVLNLLVNARDAMPGGGTITVSTASGAPAPPGGTEPSGACIVVEVRDTGHGIPPEMLGDIFEPFFTTKALGQGTGLGLASVAGTIKAHGGRIQVKSEIGQGSTFCIILPVLQLEPQHASGATEDVVRGRGHVLLVEDDRMVSMTAMSTLESLGYQMTLAPDGEKAVALVREAQTRFDLVLLDLRMPGLTGEQTFEALKALAPHLKIIIWSGYAGEQDVDGLLRRGAVAFVQKPYRVAELSRTIATALGISDSPTARH